MFNRLSIGENTVGYQDILVFTIGEDRVLDERLIPYDIYGSLAYVQTVSPYAGASKKLVAPWVPKSGNKYHHYGIAVDGKLWSERRSHLWDPVFSPDGRSLLIRTWAATSSSTSASSNSTASSSATLPVTIDAVEDNVGVSNKVSSFVLPLGATINMNGTALYQGVAAVFLAQVYGIDIGMSGLALIVVMAVGASIGSPGR